MKLFRVAIISLAACLFTVGKSMAMDATLTWLGHAAFEYTTSHGKIILIDPWLKNPKAPKIDLKRVDLILITHGHFDHVGEAFELATKYNAQLIACGELADIAKKKGVKNVQPLNASGSTQFEDVTITAVPAVHSSGFQDGDTTLYAGAPLGYVLEEYGSPAIYHAGDTGLFSDMSLINELYHPQIALLPIGGVYTMKPKEAAAAVRILQVRTVVPMHFGTFPALAGTPQELEKELVRLGLHGFVREMKPGVEVKVKDLAKTPVAK